MGVGMSLSEEEALACKMATQLAQNVRSDSLTPDAAARAVLAFFDPVYRRILAILNEDK